MTVVVFGYFDKKRKRPSVLLQTAARSRECQRKQKKALDTGRQWRRNSC